MKKAIFYTLLGGMLCFGQMPIAHAADEPTALAPVIITELQTGGAASATEEFVELYNPNDAPIDITGWQLQYRAASGTAAQSWPASSTKATFACPEPTTDCRVVIAAKQYLVLTHAIGNLAGALPMNGGFGATGGQVRIVQPGAALTVHDFVGYGNAAHAEGTPAAAPASGASIKRVVNDNSEPVDTNNNAADFMTGCGSPTPGIAENTMLPHADGCKEITPSIPPAETPPITEEPQTEPTEEPSTPAPVYLPLIITELLPDPAPPQQDSTDEFIEIYNPNDSAVTLKDYRLQTGSEYRYSFTLGDTPLGPHMYLAIPSAVSKLSLANSGSGVRLIDPGGAIAYEITPYTTAKAGQSWMQDTTTWQWTLTPTPGTANTLTLPQPKVVAVTATKKKVAAAKKPKVTAPKQAKAPAAKKAIAESKSSATQAAVAGQPHYWLLVPLGTLAAGYAAYEYRQDIGRATRTAWAKLRGKEPPTE